MLIEGVNRTAAFCAQAICGAGSFGPCHPDGIQDWSQLYPLGPGGPQRS